MTNVADWPASERPRERLLAQGAAALTDAELLAVVLGMVFWGDRPGPRLWIGGAMVLGGVLIIALRALAKMRPLQVPEEI